MPLKGDALSAKLSRVKKSIQQLPAISASLGVATDQLGKSVCQLDAVLKKFSIGIPTWVHFTFPVDEHLPRYYYEDIGYAKIGGRWGIAIRTVEGDEQGYNPDEIEEWPFAEAPRLLRVLAVEKVPELFETLLRNAAELTKAMTERAQELDVLTAGISSEIDPPSRPKIASPTPVGLSTVTVTQGFAGDPGNYVEAVTVSVPKPFEDQPSVKARK